MTCGLSLFQIFLINELIQAKVSLIAEFSGFLDPLTKHCSGASLLIIKCQIKLSIKQITAVEKTNSEKVVSHCKPHV